MPSTRLLVGNLNHTVDEKRLAEYFGEIGTVVSVQILADDEGRSRGLACLEFSTAEEASFAIVVYDGRRFAGRKLQVRSAPEAGAPPESRPSALHASRARDRTGHHPPAARSGRTRDGESAR